MREELQLLGERLRVGGRDQDAVGAVGDDVAVPGDRRGDHGRAGGQRLDQDHAEALAGEGGRAEQVRLAELAPEDRSRRPCRARRCGDMSSGSATRREISSGSAPTTSAVRGRARPAPANAESSTGRPLRSSARPTKSRRSSSLGGLRALRRSVDVDAVRDDRVLAAEPAAAGPGGGLGDGDPRGELVEAGAAPRAGSRGDWERPWSSRRGRCRRPARRGRPWRPSRRSARAARARGRRRSLPARSSRRRAIGPSGKTERLETAPFAPKPMVRAERDEVVGGLPELGVGAVQASADGVRRIPGGEHANVVSSGDELLRKRLDVPVDASLIRPGIGRDKRYAHGARVPVLVAELVISVTASSDTRRERPDYAGIYGSLPHQSGFYGSSAAPAPRRRRGRRPGRVRPASGRSRLSRSRGRPRAPLRRRRPGPPAPPERAAARRRFASTASTATAMPTTTIQKRGLPAAWAKSCAEQLEAPLSDVGEVPGSPGVEHRAGQVGVAAGDQVDEASATRASDAAQRSPPRRSRARRCSARTSPSRQGRPRRRPRRPGARSPRQRRRRSAPRRRRLRPRSPPPTERSHRGAPAHRPSPAAVGAQSRSDPHGHHHRDQDASSSLPIPKKRTPKIGFGPSSDSFVSGEPAITSIA